MRVAGFQWEFSAGLTLAITWPQAVIGEERNLAVAAQVNGDVREWQEWQAQEALTPSQSPSP